MPARIVLAALWSVGAVAVLLNTPIAAADPSDLVPVCTGDQTPADDGCSTGCPENAPLEPDGLCTEPGTEEIAPSALTGALDVSRYQPQ